jgi:hypothetical protein
MKKEDSFNFGESFPSIEIDTEHWKSLTPKQRMQYLMRLLFQEKDLGNRLNLLNYIIGTTSKVARSFIKNKEIHGYLDLLEQSTHMVSVSTAIGNILKAKQTYRNTKNNQMAELMGYPNGNHIQEMSLEVTHAMVEAFLDMSDHQKKMYDIEIADVISDGEKSSQGAPNKGSDDDDENVSIKKIKIIGTFGKQDEDAEKDRSVKFGMSITTTGGVFDGEETTSISKGKLFHPSSGMKLHPDDFRDEIQRIFYELYIDKVDTSRNFLKINGTQLEICERINITEDVVNVPTKKITTAIRKTLEKKSRRGLVLVGEPGTGKTISVHQMLNEFRDKLIFWVSPDSINTTAGIRKVFKIFKMFEGSIIVFDDIDSAPLTSKNEISNEFLAKLDGTNDLSGYFIATVNDPSKIHMSIINRPERFDDIVLAEKPKTHAEIETIIFSKALEFGYVEKGKKVPMFGDFKGKINIGRTSKAFKDLTALILKQGFTQVQVAGLISACDTYIEREHIDIKLLKEMVHDRMSSIECANMKAVKGRLEVDMNGISEEATAGLSR